MQTFLNYICHYLTGLYVSHINVQNFLQQVKDKAKNTNSDPGTIQKEINHSGPEWIL